MVKRTLIVGILILAVMLCSAGAFAAQIVQTSGTYNLLGDVQTWSVAGFDSSLGHLNSVTISLDSSMDGVWSVTNTGTRPVHTWGTIWGYNDASFNVSSTFNGVATATDSKSWDTTLPTTGASIGAGMPIHGTAAQTFTYSSTTNTLTAFYTPWQVTFDNYSAFMDINIPATALAENFVTGKGHAVVTYDYTPVPEPSSLLAFATGGIGLLGFMKRRKSA